MLLFKFFRTRQIANVNTEAEASEVRGPRPSGHLRAQSRDEVEDRFLQLREENGRLKDHLGKNEDELKKLRAELRKVEGDQSRLARLAGRGGRPGPAVAAVEELRRRAGTLQRRNEELKRRDRRARQLLCLISGRNDACPDPPRRSREPKRGRDHAAGPMEEARAEICALRHANKLLQARLKEVEGASEALRDKLRTTEVEYEKKLVRVEQMGACRMWSRVDSGLLKLQQMTEKSTAVVELQERLARMHESQRTLEARRQTAVAQASDLAAQLDNEKEKRCRLEKQVEVLATDKSAEALQQDLARASEERDLLREKIAKLTEASPLLAPPSGNSGSSQADKDVQVSIADHRVDAALDLLRQVARLPGQDEERTPEELSSRAKGAESGADGPSEAPLPVKRRRDRRDAGVQTEAAVEAGAGASGAQELRDAYEKATQELRVFQKLLVMERRIKTVYKLKVGDLMRKARAPPARTPGQLGERPEGAAEAEGQPGKKRGSSEESAHLERGRKLVELQIVGARLSASALRLLGEREPFTFCTYVFFRFDVHGTPVASGQNPRYNFTSKYIVTADDDFREYVSSCSVLVELHQKLVGCKWRTVATAHLPLRRLSDGNAEGSAPLVDPSGRARPFGSLDYRMSLSPTATEEAPERSPAASLALGSLSGSCGRSSFGVRALDFEDQGSDVGEGGEGQVERR